MLQKFEISEAARAYTAHRYSRPSWAEGTISRSDAAFLFDMLILEQPRAVVEIGVASGTSTVFMTTLFSDRLRDTRLYAFDLLNHVYSDPSKPLGAHIYDVFGRPPPNLYLGAGVGSADIRAWSERPPQFDFVFLDANHKHPSPCIDLLSILDLVKPGSWAVLHDIWLPVINREMREYGPLYLYQTWPGEKCAPMGGDASIGAIRLFEDRSDSASALVECAKLPWQINPDRTAWEAPLRALAEIDIRSREALRLLLEKPALAQRPFLRRSEIVVRGANPWSQFAPDLLSDKMVLHANKSGEPTASVVMRGLRAAQCNGMILPVVTRSPDAGVPIGVTLTLRSARRESTRQLVLADDTPLFAQIMASGEDEAFEMEIGVALTWETENMRGAWAKFEAMHLV